MYDHFKIYLHRTTENAVLWSEIPAKLEGKSWLYNGETKEYHQSGKYKTLKIKINRVQMCLEGNVGKYLNKNNIQDLTRKDIEKAFNLIGNDLGLDLSGAVVAGFEFGAVVSLDFPPALYLERLGSLKRAKQIKLGSGEIIYQCNQNKVLAFYDKSKDAEKSEHPPAHLLRYEIRFTKRVSQQLGGRVFVADLYNPKFFCRMIDLWQNEYNRITKQRNKMQYGTLTQKPTRYLIELGLKRFFEEWGAGEIGIEKAVEEFSLAGRFKSKSAKQNFKRGLIKATEQTSQPDEREINLVAELDRKINEKANQMKSE